MTLAFLTHTSVDPGLSVRHFNHLITKGCEHAAVNLLCPHSYF